MSMLKKIASLVIACAMVFQVVVFASPICEDVKGTKYEEAATLLGALEIMVGDGANFNANNNVTRAEFAKILTGTMGYGEIAASFQPKGVFNDVVLTDWSAPYIEFGVDMGAINGYGDGNFGPNDNVTGYQAVKLITYATGDYVKADDAGGYPSGYYAVAQDSGLLKSLNGVDFTQPMTRGDAAILCFNALKVDLLQKVGVGDKQEYKSYAGKTLLTERHKVNSVNGIITSNDVTGTYESSDNREGFVTIGALTLNANGSDIGDKLGNYAKVYYKWDDDKDEGNVLCYTVSANKNDSMVLDIKDIIVYDSTNTLVKYKDENDKDQEIKVSEDAAVLYNGVATTQHATVRSILNYVEHMIGDVTFIDNNGDKNYDIISVTAYDIYVVNSVDMDNYIIVDVVGDYSTGTKTSKIFKADLDSDNVLYSVTDPDGGEMDFEDIKKNDVVAIAQSDPYAGKQVIKMIVSSDTVTGKIAEIGTDDNDNLFFILEDDETEYFANDGYLDFLTNGTRDLRVMSLSVGHTAEFFLDAFGNIAYHKGAAEEIDGEYAFIYKYAIGEGANDSLRIKVLTDAGEYYTYDLAEKTKIDGVKYSGSDNQIDALEYSLLQSSILAGARGTYDPATDTTEYTGGYFEGPTHLSSIAIIELDENDRVTYIDTPYTSPDENEYTMRNPKGCTVTGFQTMSYNAQVKGFLYKYFTTAAGPVFRLPESPAEIENTRKTSVVKQSSFAGQTNYTIQMFNTNPDSYAIDVAVQKDATGSGSGEFFTADTESARRQRPQLAVIKTSKVVVNTDDDTVSIKVYGNQEGTEVELMVDPDYYDDGSDDRDSALDHLWRGGVDHMFASLASAYEANNDGIPADRLARLFVPGDLIEYGVNTDGYIKYIQPKYLMDVNWYMADTDGGLNCERRYQGGDMIQVVEYDGTYLLLREIERTASFTSSSSTSATKDGSYHNVYAVPVNAAGYITEDSEGNKLVEFNDDLGMYAMTEAGKTQDTILTASAIKSYVVYDASKVSTRRVSTGSVSDIVDTTSIGTPPTYGYLRIYNSAPQALYIIKY